MIQYNNIVRAYEHINLNVKTVYTTRQDFVFDENAKSKITITRNLIDDTFDIEIPNELIKKTSTAPVTPYVSINNTLILEGRELGRQTQGVNPNNRTFKIYHGMMKDFKFRDIKQLYVGTMVDDIVCCVYLIDINFSEMNNHVDISRGQVAEVAGFKKLTFELDHGLETGYRTQQDKTLRVKVSIEKIKLLYKPIERNRTDAITDIAEIYVYTGDEDTRLKGILPDVRSDVKSTGVTRGMSTLLNKEDPSETIDVEDVKDAPVKYKHLYSSSIDTSTYYDYEKMKTIIGYSSDSKEGEFIPFGFSGTYS